MKIDSTIRQNYDKYNPKKLKKIMGHNLVKGTDLLRKELGNKLLKKDKDIMSELEILNNFYSKHILRYGSALDLFREPKTISSDLVMRYAFKLVRFGNRKFRIKKPTNR